MTHTPVPNNDTTPFLIEKAAQSLSHPIKILLGRFDITPFFISFKNAKRGSHWDLPRSYLVKKQNFVDYDHWLGIEIVNSFSTKVILKTGDHVNDRRIVKKW